MGSFYTNLVVRGSTQTELAAWLKAHRRRSYVSPVALGASVVYDEASESQNPEVLGALAELLCRDLGVPVLAALNHDDEVLALGLYDGGALATEYESGRFLGPVAPLCRAFGRPAAAPLVWLVLRSARPMFETVRHGWLAKLLGVPRWSVGTGYNYIVAGEPPAGLSVRDLLFVDPAR